MDREEIRFQEVDEGILDEGFLELAHVDVVNALLWNKEELKFATELTWEVVFFNTCIIGGKQHRKQDRLEDKGNPKGTIPKKETSDVFYWVEAKTVESKKCISSAKPSKETVVMRITGISFTLAE